MTHRAGRVSGLCVSETHKPLMQVVIVVLGLMLLLPVHDVRAETGVPRQLRGLRATEETVGPPSKTSGRQYLVEIELYSLRRPDRQLEGTLQIGRFRRGAPAGAIAFQRKIAGQVGTSVPVEQRVGGTTVFVSRAKRLNIVAWFRDSHVFILSMREEYQAPKGLIREALRIEP